MIFDSRKKFLLVLTIALFYTALSLVYSLIGFLYYQPGSHYHEYALGKLAIEVAGHYLFGFLAALPLLDLDIALMTGALAILIDADHILSALNFDVSGRPDHSILYLIVSTALVIYVAVRMKVSTKLLTKLAFVGPITLFAHLAYDVFAASGSTFQLFIPFSFQEVVFPDYSWMILEGVALLLSVAGLYLSKKYPDRISPQVRGELAQPGRDPRVLKKR
ncbi:MAG: hypothetical protein OK457_02850 [Thaumarchaeota archaeon]|nr:hypothetical protein [Nitrososphaerota archaeon]